MRAHFSQRDAGRKGTKYARLSLSKWQTATPESLNLTC